MHFTKLKDEKPHTTSENKELENIDDGSCRSPHCQKSESASYYYERHKNLHQESSRVTSNPNPKAFCEPCKIQFMSVNTYQVHKKFYCKSRHDKEDLVPPLPVLESASGGLMNAFKPAGDTVILTGGLNGCVTPSVIQPQAIYAAISTNPLILLPCTLVPGQGLVPQNSVISAGVPGIVLTNGLPPAPSLTVEKSTITNTASPARKTSHPVMNTGDEHKDSTLLSSTKIAALKRKISEGEVLNLKKPCINNEINVSLREDFSEVSKEDTIVEQDSPLDLTVKVKKENEDLGRMSPIGRRSSVISIGHTISPVNPACDSGSPPVTPNLTLVHSTPSPNQSFSNESFTSQVPVVVHRVPTMLSDRISPLPPVLQSAIVDKPVPPPGMLPPKLMKQGNNVCEECHIVFIKYDSLVTHKKHYCAYRRRQLSAMAAAAAAAAASQEHSSDDNNSNHSGINEGMPSFTSDDSKSDIRQSDFSIERYRQPVSKTSQSSFLCDACGVKFSTSDTLVAHQTYYCMKKPDSAMSKASSKKGDDSSASNLESPFSGPEEWKCNYCDATCSSYETIRRHLLTHSEPRGYRCLLCGYKGNTLRGMRTHACEHLTEDATSVDEFMSSTVMVLSSTEAGMMGPIIPQIFDGSDEDSDYQRETTNYKNRERTSSYNSDFVKDKMLKREKSSTDASESEDLPDFETKFENNHKDQECSKRTSVLKNESGESSSDVSGNQEVVNPLAFCDVVIKTETVSGDDSDRCDAKLEQEPENHIVEKTTKITCQQRSVIRVAEKHEDVPQSSKRRTKSQNKSQSDLKSCKSCGVSFQHLSNLLTHKKFYCVSRSLPNCLPEAAAVQ